MSERKIMQNLMWKLTQKRCDDNKPCGGRKVRMCTSVGRKPSSTIDSGHTLGYYLAPCSDKILNIALYRFVLVGIRCLFTALWQQSPLGTRPLDSTRSLGGSGGGGRHIKEGGFVHVPVEHDSANKASHHHRHHPRMMDDAPTPAQRTPDLSGQWKRQCDRQHRTHVQNDLCDTN